MGNLGMEIRTVDVDERTVVGVVAPYDEVTYLVPDPGGERIVRGAFAKSIRQRGDRIPLLRNHDITRILGKSRTFDDTDEGLIGTFAVNEGVDGDALLEDLRHGYLGGLSIGFTTLQPGRGRDGVREVREAKVVEVSVVGVPAYEGAGVLAVRNAENLSALLAPFANRPDVNLEPIPPLW